MTRNRQPKVKAKGIALLKYARFQEHYLPWDRYSTRKPGRPRFKTQIVADNPDLDALASTVWGHIEELNRYDPFLFRREGRLCRIEADDNGTPVTVTVDAPRLRFALVQLFDFIRGKKKGGKPMRPPQDLAHHLVADPNPPIPILRRIVTAPIYGSNGQLLSEPFQSVDGVTYLPPKSFRMPDLPACPTRKDIQSATKFLTEDLLGDFPFTSQAELDNCLAALLTPMVREMIPGHTPLFWIDKSRGGDGGTLLSQVIAAVPLGVPPSGISAPREEAEMVRLILSTLRLSPNIFFIDNCNDRLSSPSLAQAITSPTYTGRIIGSSNNEAVDVRCLWLINGNNLRLGWELARRVVRIRIDHKTTTEERDNKPFRHPNLLSWVLENRATILYHLIVLVKAWQQKRCPGPNAKTPKFASFEDWYNTVGGILAVAERTDFLSNLDEARAQVDHESADIRAFLSAWELQYGGRPVFTSELVSIAASIFNLPEPERPAAIALGILLSKYENQIHEGWRIERLPDGKGKTRWQLRKISEQNTPYILQSSR